jgi:hypothetical protein
MPNGKPGDHPYTDIVIHKWKVFGDEIDNLVRELHNKAGFSQFREEVAQLLADHEPAWNKDADIELVKKRLKEIKAQLNA